MTKRAAQVLPDLDDAAFVAKLRPLGDTIIHKPGQTDSRTSGQTDILTPDHPDDLDPRMAGIRRVAEIEKTRGPKRRFEYLIPIRVGNALAADATARGQSAATRMLEILRDAGYPVIPEDFADLRKEKGRG